MVGLDHPYIWQQRIEETLSLQELDNVRVELFGKQGIVTKLFQELGQLTGEERKARGQELNQLKNDLMAAIADKKTGLEESQLHQQLREERVDITLPPRPFALGKLHLISKTIEEIATYFGQLGFVIKDGPDIEDDEHNFTALNFPPHHPAREAHDTFYFRNRLLLRTHTSPVQIRTLRQTPPPLSILAAGRVYRSDAHDTTHTSMFHQVEGMVIDRNINMGHLKSCLSDFCRWFFKNEALKLRFRPSFFPFTEPSAEIDIYWSKGKHNSSWLEILGCGMVHPNVLSNCGLDPESWQGFAFGMGIERVAMLKYGITDIRDFYNGDVRWLNHYGSWI